MAEIRKYNSKREIIVLENVASNDYTDNVILCVPKFAYDVARSMLAHYGKFRTSYAAQYDDQFYTLPDDTEFDTIEASIDDFLGSRDMSCDLVSALNDITSAIKTSSCCTSSTQEAQWNGSRWQSGEALQVPASFGQPGDEFESEEDYRNHKCEAANALINALIGQCNAMTIFGTIQGLIGIGALAVVPLLTVPPVGFFIAVGAAVGGSFLIGQMFSQLGSYVDANKQEWICALYSSHIATEAYDNIVDLVESWVIDIYGLLIGVDEIVNLVMGFISVDAINAMYSSVGLPEVGSPLSCASCPDCQGIEVIYGSSAEENVWDSELAPNSTTYIELLPNGDGEGGICNTATLEELTMLVGYPYTGGGTPRGYTIFDGEAAVIYQSDVPPTLPIEDVGKLRLTRNGDNPMQAEIIWS